MRLGEVETLEHQRDRSMGITVYFGQRKGSASTADFSPGCGAGDGGKGLQHRPIHGGGRGVGARGCGAHGALAARISIWRIRGISPRTAPSRSPNPARPRRSAFDSRINNSEGASLGTHQGLHVYGNTHGFVGGYPTTSHTLSCVVLAGSGEDMQRDYWYSSSRDWRELERPRPSAAKARAAPLRAWSRAA